MRRLLSDARSYVSELSQAAVGGWNRFFFTPADPTSLGLIRLVTGLLLFWSLLVVGMDLQAFLGPDGWADLEAARGYLAERMPNAWSFWFWVPESLLRPVWVGCLAVTGAFALGLGSRVTAVLAWAIAVSTSRRAPVMLYGFDQMVSTWAFYLAVCGASGQAVSLDRFLSRWRQARLSLKTRPKDGRWPVPSGVPASSVGANIGLRLIQLHLCLIYGMAGIAKLRGDAWWTGFAVWGVLAAGEFRRFNLTWVAAYPLFLNLMTHMGLLFELVYPFLIWSRLLRPLLLGFAVLLHVGIDLSLGLTEFAVAMLAGNLAFVSGRWLRSLVAGRAEDQPAGRVVYDGACPRCRAAMAIAGAADPDRVLAPVDLTAVDVRTISSGLTPGDCQRAMHWVRRDGKVSVGYEAVMAVARRLPLFAVGGIMGALPGVAWVGRWVYNVLAARRQREEPCDDERCGLPAGPELAARGPERERPATGRTRR